MKIYTDNNNLEQITKTVISRLLYEGNSEEDVKAWIEAGVEYATLADFDASDRKYQTLSQMLAEDIVSYIIGFDDEDMVYVGRK